MTLLKKNAFQYNVLVSAQIIIASAVITTSNVYMYQNTQYYTRKNRLNAKSDIQWRFDV